ERRGQYRAFQAELKKKMDCAVISDYTEYFMQYVYFYDTSLHLTEEGAKIRTKKLIADIKRWKSKCQR
ncbi:MAG: hypothetical protein IJU98_02805, partial [Synergistaceae bacterium]|nr:hypothetical protein [Synergistaceae bacterium]